jgi:hypothetical protein
MFRSIHRNLALGAAAVGLVAACSANTGGNLFDGGAGGPGNVGGGNTTSATGSTTKATTTTTDGVGGSFVGSSGSGSTGSGTVCNNPPNIDGDGDGWTGAEGDCNDCDPNVNPGAIDVADADAGMVDTDCSGAFNPPQPCDSALAIDSMDPMDAARAVELCQTATTTDKKWGVLDAKWVLPDGTPPPANPNFHLGHGMLSGFGPNVHVQAGARMFAVSSGTARAPTDPGYMDVGGFNKNYTSGSPAGFPKESPACPGVITGQPHDGTAVELTIRTPTNATGFTFDFNFFTYEWPSYVCSMFNDFFVALLSPIPMGQMDGNISFDKQGNPVSVNNAFVEVCGCTNGPPCTTGFGATMKTFTCALGDTGIQGTGFGKDTAFSDHASTGWLNTKAPVKGGENITIRWTVYDSGDGILDTTTLIDNWQWIANGGTVTVGTDPIGTPK